jgi:hypothetical protein
MRNQNANKLYELFILGRDAVTAIIWVLCGEAGGLETAGFAGDDVVPLTIPVEALLAVWGDDDDEVGAGGAGGVFRGEGDVCELGAC